MFVYQRFAAVFDISLVRKDKPLAGQFLRQIEDLPNKETLKGLIADYIVDELVINDITQGHPDEMSRRAYEYYRRMYFTAPVCCTYSIQLRTDLK